MIGPDGLCPLTGKTCTEGCGLGRVCRHLRPVNEKPPGREAPGAGRVVRE